MFVKHQLKPYMFRSQLFDYFQGVVFRAFSTFSACLPRLFGMWQTSREGSKSTKQERRQPEDGQKLRPKHVRF